jgi:Flp pilus assembly protein TadG
MRDRNTRRGNAVVIVLVCSTLLGFGALSVDIGMISLASAELQQTVDSAAFSGSQELDGTTAGIARAITTAQSVAKANPVLGRSITLATADITAGAWDHTTGAFDAYVSGDDPETINALRVQHAPPAIAPGLGALAFGKQGYTITRRSMAERRMGSEPAASSPCYLPFAIPSCHLAGLAAGTNPAPFTFTFNPSPTDSVSWGMPGKNPNSNDIRDQLEGSCDGDVLEMDDDIHVNEGVHNSALKALADILNNQGAANPEEWDETLYGTMPSQPGATIGTNSVGFTLMANGNGNGNGGNNGGGNSSGGSSSSGSSKSSGIGTSNWGNTLQGPIPLVDAGDDCSNVSFSGSFKVVGIAWGVIYDVQDQGSDKYVSMQLDVVNEHDIWGDKATSSVGTNVMVPSEPMFTNW